LTYDPRIIDILDEVLRHRLDEARSQVIQDIARELEIEPKVPAHMSPTTTEQLTAAGIDLSLVTVEEGEDIVVVSPKFLGDLWGPINDAIKKLNGVWIREGRQSRWELVRR